MLCSFQSKLLFKFYFENLARLKQYRFLYLLRQSDE